VDRYRHGLQHGCFGKGKSIRQAINNSLRNDDVFSEGSGAAIVGARHTEDLATVAEIDFSAGAIRASSARDRGIKGDSIAFGPAVYLWAYGGDSAGGFMAHHDGRNTAAGRTVVAVDVAATNSAGRHFDQEFAGPGSWRGKIGNFQMPIFGKKHRLHGKVTSVRLSVYVRKVCCAPFLLCLSSGKL